MYCGITFIFMICCLQGIVCYWLTDSLFVILFMSVLKLIYCWWKVMLCILNTLLVNNIIDTMIYDIYWTPAAEIKRFPSLEQRHNSTEVTISFMLEGKPHFRKRRFHTFLMQIHLENRTYSRNIININYVTKQREHPHI